MSVSGQRDIYEFNTFIYFLDCSAIYHDYVQWFYVQQDPMNNGGTVESVDTHPGPSLCPWETVPSTEVCAKFHDIFPMYTTSKNGTEVLADYIVCTIIMQVSISTIS